jgi:hypothetical protein
MSQSRTPSVSNALLVTTYDELHEHALSFASGQYSLLVLLGPPGLGKSQALKHSLGNRRHIYLDNHASAFGLYQLLHRHRDETVVIDDLDGVYADRGMVRLIKALCNTDPVKTLRWHSRHQDIGSESGKVPAEFETRSAVCLIANQWKTLNANIQAIEDRAIVINFRPNAGEIHVRARAWFDDTVVYDFIERHLGLIARPSMRYYVHGRCLREAHPDRWQAMLLELMGVDRRIRTLATLLEDARYRTQEERAAVFESMGLGDRSTYYRWKKKLDAVSQAFESR